MATSPIITVEARHTEQIKVTAPVALKDKLRAYLEAQGWLLDDGGHAKKEGRIDLTRYWVRAVRTNALRDASELQDEVLADLQAKL